jgi:hypothetical protein
MFAGARGYLGCLVPILGPEAEAIAQGVFKRYLGLPLPVALWNSQRDMYGDSPRRPYVLVGLPCLSIRTNSKDSVAFLEQAYRNGISHWSGVAKNSSREEARKHARRNADFLARDRKDFRANLVRRRHPDH